MQNANGNTNQTETSDVTTPVKAKRNYTKKAAANPSNQTPIAAAINPAITQTMQPIQVAVASVSVTPQLNINSLRLKLGYGETLSVKKVLVTVPVKKPNKATFFRIRDGEEWEFPALILERKEDNETYLVTADVAELVRERIMSLDQYIIEKAGKRCISYRLTKNFAEVLVRRDRLVIDLRPIDYQDPRGMVERIAENYTVTMNRRVTLASASDLDYVFGLVEQSYKNVL